MRKNMKEIKYKFIKLYPDQDKIRDLECLKEQNPKRWTSKKQKTIITIEIQKSILSEVIIKSGLLVQVDSLTVYNQYHDRHQLKLDLGSSRDDNGKSVYKQLNQNSYQFLEITLQGSYETPIELEYIQIFAQDTSIKNFNSEFKPSKQLPIELDHDSQYQLYNGSKLNFTDGIKQTRDPAGRLLNQGNKDPNQRIHGIIKQSKIEKFSPDEQLKKALRESEQTNKEEEQKRRQKDCQINEGQPELELGYTEIKKKTKPNQYDYKQIKIDDYNDNEKKTQGNPIKLGYTQSPNKINQPPKNNGQNNSENKDFKLKFQYMKEIKYDDLSLEFRQFYEQLEQSQGIQFKDKLRQMMNK